MEVESSSKKKKKNKSTSDSGESRLTYLQLRSRSIFMKPRISKNPSNSDQPSYRSSDNTLVSLSSSCSTKIRDDPESGGIACLECNSRSDDQKSTAERMAAGSRSTVMMTPVEKEIEEFLADAEIEEKKRFVDKYNFDILKGVPLEGRYEWVRM